jgi:hypothetical protein
MLAPHSTRFKVPFPTDSIRIFCLCVCLPAILVVVGCSRLPSVKLNPPFGRSDWIYIGDSHVIEEGRPALTVTISNSKKVPLWVRMEIDEIDGDDDCWNTFKLEPGMSHLYYCTQTKVLPGKRYRVEAIVYKNAGNTQLAESIRRLVELQLGPDGKLEIFGRPAD